MRVLGLKPGHDGAAALVEDGRLVFSLEGEKDGFPRHAVLSPSALLQAFELMDGPPDVVALGGWCKLMPGVGGDVGAGYTGLEPGSSRRVRLLGQPVDLFTSSHERSHLFMVAGMAPAAPLDECVILLWEGELGAFYHWREGGRRLERFPVLTQPGSRYVALYGLADPAFPASDADPPHDAAGKLMALAAFADGEPPTPAERDTVERLLALETLTPFDKRELSDSCLYDCGLVTPPLQRAAAYMSERLFATFHDAAARLLPTDLPLLITGGCGLNCEWNTRWRDCGLFSSVFVAPCANDSGSAIGTCLDALACCDEEPAILWDVYSGAPFAFDVEPCDAGWEGADADSDALAQVLLRGEVVAWIDGRAEIGPRALGHRSLLASPLDAATRGRLNAIKRREAYRPVAPVCLAEDLGTWFEDPIDDPYMLYFSRVRTDRLPAVTHVDGTARVQSVRADGPSRLRGLLESFRDASGAGVLCNTSLNPPGAGFFNTASEVFAYAARNGIEHVVVDDRWYRRVGVT
jgi:hydroxymethyl cephem carbamoyltransferase